MKENFTDNLVLGSNQSNSSSNKTDVNIYNRLSSLPILISVYVMILLFAVLGNGLVCWIVKTNKAMHHVINYLLVNLAISDLIQTIFSIFQVIDFIVKDLNLGDAGCKIQINSFSIPYSSSVLTLICIAYERYHVICRPMALRDGIKRRIKWVIPLIWVLSFCVNFPMIYYCRARLNKERNQLSCDCHYTWPSLKAKTGYGLGLVTLFYVVPLVVIICCYSAVIRRMRKVPPGESEGTRTVYQSRKKIVKMMVVTMVVFFLSWTPYNVLYTLKRFEVDFRKVYSMVWYPALLLAFLSCALNPIIYCFLSKNFRDGFKSALCSCCHSSRSAGPRQDGSSSRKSTSSTRVNKRTEENAF